MNGKPITAETHEVDDNSGGKDLGAASNPTTFSAHFGGTATHLADGEYSQLEALFNHRTMPYQLKFEGFFERFGTIGHLSRDMGQATDFVYHRWSWSSESESPLLQSNLS